MEINEFKTQTEYLIKEFQELINQMPQKGNTSDECQRILLQQKLNELEYAVNGTKDSDLNEDTHYCESCGWEGMEDELMTNTDLHRDDHEVGYIKCCPECRSENIEKI